MRRRKFIALRGRVAARRPRAAAGDALAFRGSLLICRRGHDVLAHGERRPRIAARKRYKPEEIVAKLRQVDVLVSQGQNMADAITKTDSRSRWG
jgi:hypothetical protein